ncbi:MAG: enoyl-CoA hydratase/isomerase family protein [Candidatus Eremiobacteraeota bacterium]|nr:enoyl-CoA hydratase/isomerase family protein [Candidatus Eremiobacteraeota bacterium]
MNVSFEHAGTHGEIVLDRPDALNALDDAMLDALTAAFDAAERSGTRAVLLRGEGRAFCAGRDLHAFDPAADDSEAHLRDRLTPLLLRIAHFPVPTVCAAQGAALGAGLGLALACDVTFVSDDARIGSPFRALGAVPDSGAHHWFVRRLGRQKALELIFSGRLIDGREAERLGLVARSIGRATLLDEARRFAAGVADGPTAAFAATKRIVAAIERDGIGFEAVLDHEARAQGAMTRTADFVEGIRAFQDKRTPRFEGR